MADLAAADVVIEASRPRALARFGLDAVQADASGTTWDSITATGRASTRGGFGDDVAAGAGLVVDDADGMPVFCGDAIAAPLTGLTAAVRTLTTPPGTLLDIAMTDVVGATLDGTRSRSARGEGDDWVVDAADGAVPVAVPRRRAITGGAPESGADNRGHQRDPRPRPGPGRRSGRRVRSAVLPQRVHLLGAPLGATVHEELTTGPCKIVIADSGLPDLDELTDRIRTAHATGRGSPSTVSPGRPSSSRPPLLDAYLGAPHDPGGWSARLTWGLSPTDLRRSAGRERGCGTSVRTDHQNNV
jgi:hypothetical protein